MSEDVMVCPACKNWTALRRGHWWICVYFQRGKPVKKQGASGPRLGTQYRRECNFRFGRPYLLTDSGSLTPAARGMVLAGIITATELRTLLGEG